MQNSVPGSHRSQADDPPWASTIRRAMKRPSPLPPRVLSASRPRANGSKMRCRSAAGTPGPDPAPGPGRTRRRFHDDVTDVGRPGVRQGVADDVRDRPPQLLASARTRAPRAPGPQVRVVTPSGRRDRLSTRTRSVCRMRSELEPADHRRSGSTRSASCSSSSRVCCNSSRLRPLVVEDVPERGAGSDQRAPELVRGPRDARSRFSFRGAPTPPRPVRSASDSSDPAVRRNAR